jgi:ribosomal protein S18 acetylase RimI-like enzyme
MLAPFIGLDVEAAGAFYINDVAVFPEYRHAGIARKLIELAYDEAKEADLAAVSLGTFEEGPCRRTRRHARRANGHRSAEMTEHRSGG